MLWESSQTNQSRSFVQPKQFCLLLALRDWPSDLPQHHNRLSLQGFAVIKTIEFRKSLQSSMKFQFCGIIVVIVSRDTAHPIITTSILNS